MCAFVTCPLHTIPYRTRGAFAAKDAALARRAKARANGGKTVGEAGLRLVCRHCNYVVEDSAFIIEKTGRESVVGHPMDERCPKAGEAACKWSISSRNWK